MWRDRGGTHFKFPRMDHDGDQRWITLRGRWVHKDKAMPHSWNGQANDFFGWALGNPQTSGSDVTSYSNENQSQYLSF
jgi:hypothetical protein